MHRSGTDPMSAQDSWINWPYIYGFSNGLLTLRMADGSRAWFKDGKLYIKQHQLDEKYVLIQAELEETDFVGIAPCPSTTPKTR